MKLKPLVGLLSILMFIILIGTNVCASWVGFTPQQLVENSDVILVGEVSGPIGEKLGILERFKTSGHTLWKVNVRYYLKGDQETYEFIVATPGAQSSFAKSSIDYRLDEWGKTVLLFLQKSEDIYQPITPKGVVVLNVTQYQRQPPDDQLNGELIMKEFSINDNKISQQEKTEFENYIDGLKLVLLPTRSVQASGGNWLRIYSQIIFITIISLIIFSVIILIRKRR